MVVLVVLAACGDDEGTRSDASLADASALDVAAPDSALADARPDVAELDAAIPDASPLDATPDAAVLMVTIEPTGFTFPGTPVGTMSAPKRFTVTNTSATQTGALAVQVSNFNDFTIEQDFCSGVRVDPGATCTVDVRFRPQLAGGKQTRLQVRSTGTTTVEVMLYGTGL